MGRDSRNDFAGRRAVTIRGRNGTDFTKQFPELADPGTGFSRDLSTVRQRDCLPRSDGKPNFRNVIHRMQQKTEGGIERAKA